jgi:UDP-N-acetylglucosamine acyltransferase
MKIHDSAIISKGAELDEDVEIGPYSVIGPKVRLAKGVKLRSHVVIEGKTTVGEYSEIFPFVSIGSIPQDKKYHGEESELIIGKHNVIREYTTMQPGTEGGGMVTKIGDNGLFMAYTHVAHDCKVGDNVIMANCATLAGHVEIGDHVVIGGLSAIHQFVRIGDYAIIGGMSGIERDVMPFGAAIGNRAHLAGLNLIGLKRNGFSNKSQHDLRQLYKMLFTEGESNFASRLQQASKQFAGNEVVEKVLAFFTQDSSRAFCMPKNKQGEEIEL